MPEKPISDEQSEVKNTSTVSSKSRGKRRGKKPFRGKGASSSAKQQSAKHNDVGWYYKYPELADNAARIGFHHIGGTPYSAVLKGSNGYNNQRDVLDPAQILRINYITTPGISKSATSGFAMQIRKLYLAMKIHYRGLNTYEASDLAVTIYSIAEFYRYIAKLERIYGVCRFYSVANRTMPALLPAALRFDYDNITAHLADFRAGINTLITRAATLCLPNGMDIINRWFLLESNVFKDSDDARAAYVVFDDGGYFYTYQSTVLSTGGAAVLSDTAGNYSSSNFATYEELLRSGSDMLDILLNDDDVTLQLGDLIAYFKATTGSQDLLSLALIPEDYTVVPVKNEEILVQIHNLNTIGRSIASDAVNGAVYTSNNFEHGDHAMLDPYFEISGPNEVGVFICQDRSNPYFSLEITNVHTAQGWGFDQSISGAPTRVCAKPGNFVLDTWKEAPTEKDVMEMTRLTPGVITYAFASGSDYINRIEIDACGTEVVMDFDIFDTSWSAAGDEIQFNTLMNTGFASFPALTELSQIDWHPQVYELDSFPTVKTASYTGWTINKFLFADLDNARVIEPEILHFIHDAAVMSLFEIPSVKEIKESK